jgi:hypothetical protein
MAENEFYNIAFKIELLSKRRNSFQNCPFSQKSRANQAGFKKMPRLAGKASVTVPYQERVSIPRTNGAPKRNW